MIEPGKPKEETTEMKLAHEMYEMMQSGAASVMTLDDILNVV